MRNLFFIFLLFSLDIFSQENNEKKSLKHESGDVVIVASDAADYYNRKNLAQIRQIRVSILNHLGEEEYKKLLDEYITGQVSFNSRNFVEARRIFENNQKNIQAVTLKLVDHYKKRVAELARDSARISVEIRMDNTGKHDSYSNAINKFTKNANDAMNEAESLVTTSNNTDAVRYYKEAIFNFLKIIYYSNKSQYQNFSPRKRAENNIYIDDDYVTSKFFKDYDDSKDELFSDNETRRKKEKDYIVKLYKLETEKTPEQSTVSTPGEKDAVKNSDQ